MAIIVPSMPPQPLPTDPSDLVRRLRRLDSCALSDALDSLDLPGAVAGIRPVAAARRIAGHVQTVRLGLPTPVAPTRHLCAAAVDASGPGDVIVVEHHARPDAAGWGGILSTAARARGLSGVIVDGAVRDVDDSEAACFPVFARHVVPFTARGRIVELAWGQPISVGEVVVRAGDLVIADRTGVVFIAAGRVRQVLAAAERIAAREAAMSQAVCQGCAVSDVMSTDYEQMLVTARAEGEE